MKKFAFFILILVVTLGIGTIFLYTDFFLLKEIDIESGWIPKEEILQLSSLEVGQNLFYLNQIDLVKKIKEDPRVDEVEFKKVYPEKLLIRIVPRKPAFIVLSGNKNLLIDEKGILIAINLDYPGIPTLKEFSLEKAELGEALVFKSDELYANAISLIQLCKQADMRDIVIFEENGYLFLHLGEGYKAAFGKGDEIEKKFNNFYAIYEDLKTKDIEKGTINLTNVDAPTYLPFD